MMGVGHGFGLFGFGGGSIMMVIVSLLIGYLIYLAMKNQSPVSENRNQSVASSDPIEIVKSRLAKGEISFEEFEQIKKNLV